MFEIRKIVLSMVCLFVLAILSACGFSVEHNEDSGQGTTDNANGTMLAGQELSENDGIIKTIKTEEEVIITVSGQDENYRLSEDAKIQIEQQEVGEGSEVTFTTYSIGDDKDTIDRFVIK